MVVQCLSSPRRSLAIQERSTEWDDITGTELGVELVMAARKVEIQ